MGFFSLSLCAKDLVQLRFEVMERQENCLASESFARKVADKISYRKQAASDLEGYEKTSFETLNQCAKEHGIKALASEDSLFRAFRECPEAYEAWVSSTPSKLLLKEEMKELEAELSRIKKFIQHSCLAMN